MDHSDELDAVAEGIEALVMWVRRQAPSKVSTSTVTTLDTLATQGPQRISDLAAREAISQPGMTTLVNRLERAGLAERVADPSDGRAALVRITGDGRRLLAERGASRAAALREHLAALGPEARHAMVAARPAVRLLIAGPTTTHHHRNDTDTESQGTA